MTTRRAVLKSILGLQEQTTPLGATDRLLVQPGDGSDALQCSPARLWPMAVSAAPAADLVVSTVEATMLSASITATEPCRLFWIVTWVSAGFFTSIDSSLGEIRTKIYTPTQTSPAEIRAIGSRLLNNLETQHLFGSASASGVEDVGAGTHTVTLSARLIAYDIATTFKSGTSITLMLCQPN